MVSSNDPRAPPAGCPAGSTWVTVKRTSYWRVTGSGKGLVLSVLGPIGRAQAGSLRGRPLPIQGVGLLGEVAAPEGGRAEGLGARPDLAARQVDLAPAEADDVGDRGAVDDAPD